MRIAVTIPDEIFEKVDRFARRAGKSRGRVFNEALRDYLARHAPDEITEAMDRVAAELHGTEDAFTAAASRRLLERVEW